MLTTLLLTPCLHAILPHSARALPGHAIRMNLFGDIFDDSRLKPQNPPARPLLPSLVRPDAASYVLRESMFSFSGEDFRVRDIHGNEVRRPRAHRNRRNHRADAVPVQPSHPDLLKRAASPSLFAPSGLQLIRINGGNINLGGLVIDKLGMMDGGLERP
eukprot:scaffold11776_cov107-Isochrysis_galbana.AAC.1